MADVGEICEVALVESVGGRRFSLLLPPRLADMIEKDHLPSTVLAILQQRYGTQEDISLSFEQSVLIVVEAGVYPGEPQVPQQEPQSTRRASAGPSQQPLSEAPESVSLRATRQASAGPSQQPLSEAPESVSLRATRQASPGPSQQPLLEAPESASRRDRSQWSHEATLLLINERQEKDHLFLHNTTQRQAWRRVASSMEERGYCFTAEDCCQKFRNLKQRYKTIKDKHGTTGSSRCHWPYFDLLDAMFQSDPAIVPVAPVASMPWPTSSSATSAPQEEEDEEMQAHDELPTLHVPRRRKRKQRDEPEWFKTFHEDLKKMHMERLEEDKRKTEIERQRLAVLTRIADNLEKLNVHQPFP